MSETEKMGRLDHAEISGTQSGQASIGEATEARSDAISATSHASSGGKDAAGKLTEKQNNEGGEGEAEDKENEGPLVGDAPEKKKKKKSKPKSKRGLGKPTGFEEFYAEAPLTPSEAKDNLELYTASKPVDERIQTAVQRFTARRKFDSDTKEVFDRYLVFGGVDAGPNMFGGIDDPNAGDLTAQEIATLKNTKFLNEAVLRGEMVVDFDGVLKAFLSCYSAMWFSPQPEAEIKRRVNVIRNFLNYLLHHDVCPEYKDQVVAAKQTCDVGEAQLWLTAECARRMPGDFNIACSLLFHGWYHDCYMYQLGDEKPSEKDRRILTAQNAFRAALASHGTDRICDVYQQHNSQRISQPLRKFRTGLEVVRVEFANDQVKQLYNMPMFRENKPTGKLVTRVWHNPASLEQDLSEEEEQAARMEPIEFPEFEFWIEEEVLGKIFTGMKFEADVYELTFGVYFFDSPTNFRCSFFSWLPNEAMIGWREHEYLPPRTPSAPAEMEIYED